MRGSDTCVVKRLPKSLRQLYGSSADAEARTRIDSPRAGVCRTRVLQGRLVRHAGTRDDAPGRFKSGVFKTACSSDEVAGALSSDLPQLLGRSKGTSQGWTAWLSIPLHSGELRRPDVSLLETIALALFKEELPVAHAQFHAPYHRAV